MYQIGLAADIEIEWDNTVVPGRYAGSERRDSGTRRVTSDRRQAVRLEVGIEDRRRTTGRRVEDR